MEEKVIKAALLGLGTVGTGGSERPGRGDDNQDRLQGQDP